KGAGPGGKTKQSKPPTPKPPRKLQRFRINRINGGFSITPGEDGAVLPPQLDIRTAYDVRRGNPIARYRPEDLKLNDAAIKAKLRGVEMLECKDNRMVVKVLD